MNKSVSLCVLWRKDRAVFHFLQPIRDLHTRYSGSNKMTLPNKERSGLGMCNCKIVNQFIEKFKNTNVGRSGIKANDISGQPCQDQTDHGKHVPQNEEENTILSQSVKTCASPPYSPDPSRIRLHSPDNSINNFCIENMVQESKSFRQQLHKGTKHGRAQCITKVEDEQHHKLESKHINYFKFKIMLARQ